MVESLVARIEQLRSVPEEQLSGALHSLLRGEEEWLAAADIARSLATGDVDWSIRLASAVQHGADGTPAVARRAISARAHALCYKGAPEEALALLDDPAADWASDAPVEQAAVRLARVQPLFLLGRLPEAAEAARMARDGFVAGGDRVRAAMAEVNLGGVLRRLNQPAAALSHYDNAREALAADPVRRAMIDSNRAEALLDLDRYHDAMSAFADALSGFDAAQNSHAAALVEGNIAELHSRRGHPHAALERFEAARQRLEALGADVAAEAARLCIEEADCLARIGALRESLARIDNAIATLDQSGLAFDAARACLVKGAAQAQMSEYSDAEETLREAQRRFQQLDNQSGLADVETLGAELAMRRGSAAAAISLLQSAARRIPERRSQLSLIHAQLSIALAESGDFAAARSHAATAQTLAAELGVTPLLGRARYADARVLLAAGEQAAAVVALREAAELLEKAHRALPADRLRYAFLINADEILRRLCTAALDLGGRGGIETAIESLERSSARGLLDLLSGADQPADAESLRPTQPVLAAWSDCQSEISIAYERIGLFSAGASDAAAHAAARERLRVLESQHEELETRLLASGGLSTAFARPLDLSAIQQRLAPDAAIVHYFVEEAGYGAIVIRNREASVCRQIGSNRFVAAAARQVQFLIAQTVARAAAGLPVPSRWTQWSIAAANLAEALLSPLHPYLQGVATIGFVPSGDLHGVPLGALAATAMPRHMIRSAALLPSASIGVRSLLGAPPGRRARVVAVGVADRLAPEMEREAVEVAQLAESPVVLLGQEATMAAFEQSASQADVIHIAAHAVFGDSHPNSSRIRFADGWIDARRIARMRLRPALVVLAGCESGRSADDTGAERYGLVRAFLAAGAATVIASHWPLGDTQARLFFTELHQRIWAGEQPGEAAAELCRMQREFEKRGVHPAYWAGLYAVRGGLS